MDKEIKRIKELTTLLNHHRDAYYNDSKPEISDYEYDTLYDELKELEHKTGILFNNSPTQSVGYEVKSKLEKITHNHPMLSLAKTKSVSDLIKFAGDRDYLLSLKMDGLTVLLAYEDGKLVQAETRGNGEVGELITHNAKVFENIPLTINYPGHLEVEGEAIITYEDFEKINLVLMNGDRYKNPRNLASGSVRQLDSAIAAERHIKFVCWKVPTDIGNSMTQRLSFVENLGFDIVPYVCTNDLEHMDFLVNNLKSIASDKGYPIDGLVMAYNDILYGDSLGMTGHHPKHSIAFKFYDEEVESELVNIDWTMGKTGILTPTAIFKPVEIDGTTVTRASLHNISVMKETLGGAWVGRPIRVYKANMIIPQLVKNDDDLIGENPKDKQLINIPTSCPVCNGKTEIVKDNDTEVLTCTNPDCEGKLLGKLTHAVSKNALNVDGLSEATIEKFISLGWLTSIRDIYYLRDHADQMMKLEGFGKASVNKLMVAIDNSTHTTLDRFLYALSIPLCGRTASKEISKFFDGDFNKFYIACSSDIFKFDWTKIDGFGKCMSESINDFMLTHLGYIRSFADLFAFENKTENSISGGTLESKSFCITGKLTHFENRDALVTDIESKGGKFVSSVSKTTDYLINNDNLSQSSKNVKAAKLGIPVITEEDYMKM